MKVLLISLLSLGSMLTGVYTGLCITDKKVLRTECVKQVLTFSCAMVAMYYIKYLSNVLIPIDKALLEVARKSSLFGITMFLLEVSIMFHFTGIMLKVLRYNVRKFMRGLSNATTK